MDDPLLKVADVAKLLNISPKYVQLMATSGELPCVRMGVRIFRFRRQDLEDFMERVKTSQPDTPSQPTETSETSLA
jgi:excisionase family DNA binding protein